MDTHLGNPDAESMPSDWCYGLAHDVVSDGVRDLPVACGRVTYACGREGVPEPDAGRRVLQEMLDRSRDLERAKVLLAELDPCGWWRLSLEHDDESDESDKAVWV